MARQASSIRAEMIAMRNSLTKFNDGGTAGWGDLQRNLEKLLGKWDAYDSEFQSLVEFAADVESVTEELLRDEARAHEAFQGELLILRDQAQEVIDRGLEEAEAWKTLATSLGSSSCWASGLKQPMTASTRS